MSEEQTFESNYIFHHKPKHVEILDSLKKIVQHYNFKMVNTDFLQTWDKSEEEIKAVVLLSQLLQRLYNAGVSLRVWQSGLAVAIFRDQSTRTRFSWCSAANMLGLLPQDFDEKKSQIAHGETTRETANMISFCTEVVGIRDDLFVGQGHSYELEFGTALDNGFKEGCLNQRTTVINLQSDTDHPTQSLSDLIHLKEFFGDNFEDLKGKKIAVSWGYSPSYGKPLSVPQGLIGLLTRFGMNVTLAHPEGFDLLPEIVDIAKKQSLASGGTFELTHDMNEAVTGAHVVYCKSWGSLDLMKKRSEMIAQGKASDESMKIAEKEALKESEKFQNWEYNEEKQKLTHEGNALYMHCLPADISGDNCKTGEVSKGVFAANRIAMYKEARNKPYVIASMMMLTRIENVVPALESFVESPTKRNLFVK